MRNHKTVFISVAALEERGFRDDIRRPAGCILFRHFEGSSTIPLVFSPILFFASFVCQLENILRVFLFC